MPAAKPGDPRNLADLRFPPERARTRQRYRRILDARDAVEEKAARKRTAAAKKGAEGPKKSKPGGYSMSYTPGQSGKKKRKV
jgi:hypothetical protein